jgi:hypothetical protein
MGLWLSGCGMSGDGVRGPVDVVALLPLAEAAPQPIVSGMWLPLGYGIRAVPHPRHGDGLGGAEP